MKILFAFSLLLQCSCTKTERITVTDKKPGAVYLNSISELHLTNGGTDVIAVVKDSLRGGLFYFKQENLVPDSGTVFKAANSGYWVRFFEKSAGYNVDWFGAKGDGIAFDDTCIQHAINAAGTGATLYCRPEAIYILRNALFFKNHQVFLGKKAIFKRAPSEERFLLSSVPASESSFTLNEVPANWKPGDDIQVYTDSSGDKASILTKKIQLISDNTITIEGIIGSSNDNTISTWPAGTKIRKVFTMITAPDPNAVSTSVVISDLILDGNKEQNNQNFYWGVNSALFLRGIGNKIEDCIFRNMPNESITGHGLVVENCQGYNLNGSFVHLSGLMTLDGQANSFIKDNYTNGTNLIPNATSKHSEAVITTSFTGGYATIVNNRFYNGGESVIGHLNPPTGNINDGGTSEFIFQNNICTNFRKIVYQIIDPINFGYSDSARNIVISNNVFSACGTTDWRNYEYFIKWYIGLAINNNVYSNGTMFLLPPSLLSDDE